MDGGFAMDFLALDYINTEWFVTHYHFRDVLTDPALLKGFLEKWQLKHPSPPSPDITEALIRYRAFLSGALRELMAQERLSATTAAELEKTLASCPGARRVCLRDGRYETRFQPFQKDWNWVMAEVAASFIELADMETGRIRVCDNPGCRWIFYDETRSRTKRCCDGTCANLVKMRRFRQKKKEKA